MKLPKQVYVPYVGALFDLANKVMFIVNSFSFMMITRNTFYNANDSYLKDTFGTYGMFLLAFSIIATILLYLAHVFLVPSVNKYTQDQAVIEGRSLMYEKMCEIERKLENFEVKKNN